MSAELPHPYPSLTYDKLHAHIDLSDPTICLSNEDLLRAGQDQLIRASTAKPDQSATTAQAVGLCNLARLLHMRSPAASIKLQYNTPDEVEYCCGDLYILALTNAQRLQRATHLEPAPVVHTKYIVIGDSAVGKTAFWSAICKRPYSFRPTFKTEVATLGTFPGRRELSMQLWDNTSQPEPNVYKDADAVFLLFDLTAGHSFETARTTYYRKIKASCKKGVCILLVGTKSDLKSSRQVSAGMITTWTRQQQVDYIEVSANNNENISEAWALMNKLVEQAMGPPQDRADRVIELAKMGLACLTDMPAGFLVHGNHPEFLEASRAWTPSQATAQRDQGLSVQGAELPNGLHISSEQWFHRFGCSVLFKLNNMPYTMHFSMSTLILRECKLHIQWPHFVKWLRGQTDTIQLLDLSDNSIDFDSLLPLKQALREKPGLKRLIFDKNCLTSDIPMPVCKMILDHRLSAIETPPQPWGVMQAKLTDISTTDCPRGHLLTHVRLSNNLITNLSVFKTGLFDNVTTLNLADNRIEAIDDLVGLSYLVTLDLSRNRLTTLPLKISQWHFLLTLLLADNLLTSATEVTGLPLLTRLDLTNNRLETLPLTISEKLKELALLGNPLEPRLGGVLSLSSTEVPNFLRELHKTSAKEWRQLKVVTAGKASVGKTHLTRRLQGQVYGKNQSTDGIEVNILKNVRLKEDREIDICIYDLGGQEVFYPTHMFFLSGKTIYLLVFDARDPDLANLEYWVRTLKIKFHDAGIQVVFVGTHIDLISATKLPQIQKHLKNKFERMLWPLKFHIAFVDCTARIFSGGFDKLRTLLWDLASESHIFQQVVPASYLDTFDMISKRSSEYSFIDYEQYKKLFVTSDKSDESVCTMNAFLHEAGAITWFDVLELRNIVVINPQWLADLMSCLVSFKVKWTNGQVSNMDLQLAWKKYSQQYLPTFIALMSKFEIIFKLKENMWAIPCMLPEAKSAELAQQTMAFELTTLSPRGFYKRHRVFSFEFLPRGLFAQLFVRLMHLNNVTHLGSWLNGLLFCDKTPNGEGFGEKIYIELQNAKELTITSLVRAAGTSELFSNVIAAINGLISSHFHKNVEQILPQAACNHCIALAEADPTSPIGMIPISILEFAFMNSLTTITCPMNKISTLRLREVAPDVCMATLPACEPQHVQIGDEVGRGASGIIHRGDYKGYEVAIKSLMPNTEQFRDWQHEVLMMSRFDHPNLVKLHGIMLNPLRMVMELCNKGDLHALLSKHPNMFTWEMKASLLLDIARGVLQLHSAKPPIIHRDLRTPNIFITEVQTNNPEDPNGTPETFLRAKVGDLGLSRQAATKIADSLATWRWVAPETMSGTFYDEASDIYSFGTIAWHMAHPTSWPYDDCPDEFKLFSTFKRTKEEIEHDPGILDKYTKDPSTYQVTENEDGGITVVETQIKEMLIKKAIISSALRPQFTAPNVPGWIRQLAVQCWSSNPNRRPRFAEIVAILEAKGAPRVAPTAAAAAAVPAPDLPAQLEEIQPPVPVQQEEVDTRFTKDQVMGLVAQFQLELLANPNATFVSVVMLLLGLL